MPIDTDALDEFIKYTATRKEELDKLSEEVANKNAATVQALKNLDTPNAGKTPKVGEKVKQSEVDAYFANKPIKAKGESNTAYNERITQWYKDQPHSGLTEAQAAAKATLQWERTGKAGEGKYVVVYPFGVAFDKKTGEPIINEKTGKAKNVFTEDGNNNTNEKTIVSQVKNPNGSITITYSDGTTSVIPAVVGSSATTNSNTNVSTAITNTATQTQADAQKAAAQQNAITFLTTAFQNLGLSGDMASSVVNLVQQGYTTDTIQMIAQDPNSQDPLAISFRKRFPANAIRVKQGLSVLTPGEYIATEDAYRKIFQAAGLPKGFYDSTQDLSNFIAQDISPTEVKNRVDLAAQAISNADPLYAQSLQTMYGLSTGDLIAHMLDPNAAMPLLQKQAAAVQIGTAAARQGLGVSATAAENLYGQGVTQAQAEVGFKNIAANIAPEQSMAQRWGGDAAVQGQNLVAATFGTAGAAYAEQQLRALANLEVGAFSGGSAVDKGSLGIDANKIGGAL